MLEPLLNIGWRIPRILTGSVAALWSLVVDRDWDRQVTDVVQSRVRCATIIRDEGEAVIGDRRRRWWAVLGRGRAGSALWQFFVGRDFLF